MSIIVSSNDHAASISITTPESVARFIQMLNKALNVWPDAHPELKEFADNMQYGKSQQDYWAQRTDIKSQRTNPDLPSTGQLSGEELAKRLVPVHMT